MNQYLQSIKDILGDGRGLSQEETEALAKALKSLDKEITILEFKLDRTEKVKRTTSILLEETIEELEQKRKDVEKTNEALKKSLEDLKSAQAQLIQSEKMASLGELTAGIAHEIKNPLNFVNNFADVSGELLEEMKEELQKGNNDEASEIAEDVIQNLEKILHHGRRADSIVKGMLLHSRTSEGKKEPTDINALVDEYLRLAFHGLKAKDKSLNADMETDFDETIGMLTIVPQDIGRVLLNLITNAFYAVEEKNKIQDEKNYKPKVSVSTTLKNGNVVIAVIDNGSGIPKDVIDKIFQPFFTTKPTGEGTGLGLSLSYDIVKAHGGDITVASESGKGTTFSVTLPWKITSKN